MIKKSYVDIDVVTAAKQRIKNIFATSNKVSFSISGGKDSIVLNDLVFKLCLSGEIDKSKLVINFIDEEAIYPCVERIVKNIRLQWLSLGVTFNWWCIEVKHFNCLNQLTSDESFICWDRYKKDVWVRPMPKFALTDHPLLNKRVDRYQQFLTKLNRGSTTIMGVRTSESLQRLQAMAKKKTTDILWPIYDFCDVDIWKYIKDNNLDIPEAYMYMYQVGVKKNNMRISQFFSVDTVMNLVQMCEFYPNLFERICKREPNAYMVMLYFDTELFRRQKKSSQVESDENIDYKQKVLNLLGEKDRWVTEGQLKLKKQFSNLILNYANMMDNLTYKKIYGALVGGDPKGRSYRAIISSLRKNIQKKNVEVK